MAKKLRFPKEKKLVCNKDGSEIIDSKPLEIKVGLSQPVSLRDKMKQLWAEFKEKDDAANQYESIQDSMDFDVDKNAQVQTAYEVEGDLEDELQGAEILAQQEIQAKQKENVDVKENTFETSSEQAN